ncbi:TPA: hypothetical protein HA361_00830 [Candidatus Woesearchaeota archaeon]|nr:hypothetical protein [Candidatus Woesearchaeota archaeon]HII68792.1 hypothetical protein [Candidatus Woesearchaeota archaeon]
MNRKKFVQSSLERLMNDSDVQKYFSPDLTKEEKERTVSYLSNILADTYDTTVKGYFENKGLSSYVSTFLRWTGAAEDAIGTYLFWAMGGAGFVAKTAGVGSKSLADYLDNRHYEKYKSQDAKDSYITKDGMLIASEGLLERAASYDPGIIGGIASLADLIRGTAKYDTKVIARGFYDAKDEFLKKMQGYQAQKMPKIIPLERFRNSVYTEPVTPVFTPAEERKLAA